MYPFDKVHNYTFEVSNGSNLQEMKEKCTNNAKYYF